MLEPKKSHFWPILDLKASKCVIIVQYWTLKNSNDVILVDIKDPNGSKKIKGPIIGRYWTLNNSNDLYWMNDLLLVDNGPYKIQITYCWSILKS